MRQWLSVTSLIILVVALVGVGSFVLMQPLAGRAEGGEGMAAATAKTRGELLLSVDDAMRELHLIRPTRRKGAGDFTVPTLDGRTFRLSDQRGKVVFINFWATWCAPCLEEMPTMERLWRRHENGKFVLLAVSVDADSSGIASFLAQHGLTFLVGLDPKMRLAGTYGVRGLPSSFIVDRHGRLAALAVGPRAWDNDAANALIEGMTR